MIAFSAYSIKISIQVILKQLKIVEMLGQPVFLKAILSVPCFEFWLLLHFEFSTKPYNASGTASACDRLIRDLRGYMPSYAKGNKCEFESILRKTDQAIVYSKQALHQVTGSGADDPTTRMHELVEYLQQLRIKT